MRARTQVALTLVALGIAAAVPAEDALAVDIPGVVYDASSGSYYKVYTTAVTWTQAKAAAISVGGHLAVITSSSENSFIVSSVGISTDSWIGGTDEASEGTWVWVTGETWNYTSWNSGEPNNVGNEDYCSIKPNGTWNDLPSSSTAPYVVEWAEDPNGPPTDPSSLVAVATSESRVDLSWNDNSTRETGFEIERAVGEGAFALLATRGANTKSHADTDVTVETAYAYRVRAVGSGGNSEYTNIAEVVTPSPAVQNLQGVALSSTVVALSWNDVASQETGFRVERGVGPAATSFSTVATLPANTTSHNDTTASSETTYTYRLRTLGPDGSPSSGPTVVVTTQPGPPGYFAASTPDGPHVHLEWLDTSEIETHFEIQRRTTSPVSAWTSLANVGELLTSYEDATVVPETAYAYRIRTGTASGSSEWSAESQITTPPTAPEDVVALPVSTNLVRLSWTDRSVYERNFVILRKVLPDGVFEPLATVGKNVTTYDDERVSQEGRYVYRIAATWSLGRSEYVDTAEVVRTPAALTVGSFVIKPGKTKGSKVKPGRVDIRGTFDTGEETVLLDGPTTLEIGGEVIAIPSLARSKKLLRYDSDGTLLTLLPSGSSTHVAFSLRLTGAIADALDPDGEVSLRYTSGEFSAEGTVHLASGRFQPGKAGHVVSPPVDLSSLSVKLTSGVKDRFKAKGTFDPSAGAPDNAPDVIVQLGLLSFRTLPTSFTRSGDRWIYKEKDGPSNRKLTLDYAKGQFSISLSSIDVGPYGSGRLPVTVSVSIDGVLFEDTPVFTSNGKSLGY